MPKPKVFITRKIPEEGLRILEEAGIQYDMFPHAFTPPTKQQIMNGVQDCDGLVSLLSDPIDQEVLESSTKLRIVSQYAVGYNNIDLDTAKDHGITVTNTPGVLTDATADLTWGLILSAARHILTSDKYTRNGNYLGWAPLLQRGLEIRGKTLGIVGAGRIGSAVAMRARGFDMEILYHNRNRNPELEKSTGAKLVQFHDLIKRSDIISVHTPLTPETHHLFSMNEFKQMKDTAIFINTSRGPCVNESDLLEALRKKVIYAAGLDVYEREPAFTKGLEELDNVVMVAHIGSSTMKSRAAMSIIAAENLVEFFVGREPKYRVV
jgi:glyoxylate reductase